MWVVGLTGGIGSGKSSVSRWFRERGVPVIDADATVHRLLEEDQPTIQRIAESFGNDILDEHGKIDRKMLGARIFGDALARQRLESILHPLVKERMMFEQKALSAAGENVCIWDVPLLFEAGFYMAVDEVWVVWVSPEVQTARVMSRDSLSRVEVELRIRAQLSLAEKAKRADVVIDNSGSWEQTVLQLEPLWERLKEKDQWKNV